MERLPPRSVACSEKVLQDLRALGIDPDEYGCFQWEGSPEQAATRKLEDEIMARKYPQED